MARSVAEVLPTTGPAFFNLILFIFFYITLKGYWLRRKKLSIKRNPACRQILTLA